MDDPSKSSKTRRIILFPLPFQGHINPMIQLANILHSKGFTISIIHTHFNSPDPSKYPHLTFHFIPVGLSEDQASIHDILRALHLLNTECIGPSRECLRKLLATHDDIQCMITDAMMYCSKDVVEDLGIHRIVLRTSSVCSFLAFATLPLLQEKGYFSDHHNNLGIRDDPVPELPPLRVKDIPSIQRPNPNDALKIIRNMVQGTKTASGLILNTFQELEEPNLDYLCQHFRMPTFLIGPFHKFFSAASSSLLTQDRSAISWLDTQKPDSVLYVSFGSLAAMDEDHVTEVAWGLANSMQPFLWVVRPGLVQGSEWLESLPNEFLEITSKRGYIVKWAPQQEVLSHPAVGGFWTHSGWNSVLESICEGVPMICSSFFSDQTVNSRYINDVWKLGIKLECGLKREEIESAIRKILMLDREGQEIRERALCLKVKIQVSLKTDGFSSQSLNALSDLISSFQSSCV
ncbi:UDP-glycosyltransferase 76B1-like isoform X2 [Henckelia pumila]|uniref:UDP-glycosyltransferase 76B1-like isoform X2 n=1 Tax=Henckelia pumila TaxID=405737 RepID=UPI003C6DFA64